MSNYTRHENEYGLFGIYDTPLDLKENEVYEAEFIISNGSNPIHGTRDEIIKQFIEGKFDFNSSFNAFLHDTFDEFAHYPNELRDYFYDNMCSNDYGKFIRFNNNDFAILNYDIGIIESGSLEDLTELYLDGELEFSKDLYAIFIDCYESYDEFPEVLKEDKTITLTAIEYNPKSIKFASDRLKDDEEVVFTALKQDNTTFYYASDRLKNDKEMVKYAVERNGWALSYASKELQDNLEIVMTAFKQTKQTPGSFKFASDRLKDDKNVVCDIVKNCGAALEYASDRLKDDPEVVILAMKNNPYWAFISASDRLQEDKKFIIEALKDNQTCFDLFFDKLSNRLQNDKDIRFIRAFDENQKEFTGKIEDCFEFNGKHFFPIGFSEGKNFYENMNLTGDTLMDNYGENKLYSHKNFYNASGNSKADIFICYEDNKNYIPCENNLREYTGKVLKNYDLLKDTTKTLRNDKDLMLAAVKQDVKAYELLSDKLKKDKDILSVVNLAKKSMSLDEKLKLASSMRNDNNKSNDIKDKNIDER